MGKFKEALRDFQQVKFYWASSPLVGNWGTFCCPFFLSHIIFLGYIKCFILLLYLFLLSWILLSDFLSCWEVTDVSLSYQVKRICPNDPDAAKKLKECEKAVMKLKFEEAISVPESERHLVADSIDYNTIGKVLFLCSFDDIWSLFVFF